MTVLDEIVQDQLRTDLPELSSGDTVRVSAKVVEGNRERVQVFEGTVMRLRGGGITRSITVRRLTADTTPMETPKVSHNVAAPAISQRVLGARLTISLLTEM